MNDSFPFGAPNPISLFVRILDYKQVNVIVSLTPFTHEYGFN